MKNSEAETMIFFSLHYPYHFTDSYLDEEINLLAARFKKIVIITANTYTEEKRPVPPNAVVYRFSPKADVATKSKSTKLLLTPGFYRILLRTIFKYKIGLNAARFKELFAFYSRALATKDFLEKVIEEQQLDKNNLLIYTYWMIESTMASVMLKEENAGVKVISKAHSQDVYFDRSPVGYHPFAKYIFKGLNHLFFISDNARNYFVAKHGINVKEQQRLSISRIGIKGPDSVIAKKKQNVLRIVSVAYIQKIKRVDLIIDALALISNVTIEWYHAGHSNQNEADFEAIKKYAADKLGVHSNISFTFLGKTGKEDLFRLYADKNFDLFLNVSETEGIPVSMMEAMSYSVPVIGTNVGGVAEIVEDGKNGFLLSPYPNATEVQRSILNFWALTEEQYNAMRQSAYDTWHNKYSADVNYNEMVKAVDTLLKQK